MGFVQWKNLCFLLYKTWSGLSILLKFSTLEKIKNLLKCYFEYLRGKEFLSSYPFTAVIDPGNRCNLRCPYCLTGSGKNKDKASLLSLESFEAIINAWGKYFYMVSLFLYGEPFLNRDILSMVRFARSKNIACMIHSNLNIPLDRKTAESIVNSGLTHLSVSIDGASNGTYIRYRVNGNLDLVLSNINLINDAKKRLGSRTPALIWQYLLFNHNEHELKDAARLARDRKMHFRVIAPDCLEVSRSSMFFTRGQPFVRNGRCSFLWTTLFVTSDMRAVPCCQWTFEHGDFGDICLTDLHKSWNSSQFQMMRNVFSRAPSLEGGAMSQFCHHCQQNRLWAFLFENKKGSE